MEDRAGVALRPREQWIDGLRALALLFVIYVHQGCSSYGFKLLSSPVKIPLFFAITGYVFNEERRDPRAFAGKLLRGLVVPWLALGLLGTLAVSVLTDIGTLPARLIGLLTGEDAWYMPCCIAAECLWFLILKYGRNAAGICCAALAAFGLGLLAARLDLLNLWMINRALIAQAWILVGWLLRHHGGGLKRLGWRAPAAAAALYIALALLSHALYPGKSLNVHGNRYYSLPICLAMIAVGNAALFTAFSGHLKNIPRAVSWFGRNTLVIYMVHNYTVRLPAHLLKFAGLPLTPPLALAAMVPTCALYMLVAAGINRFAPALAGRPRPCAGR